MLAIAGGRIKRAVDDAVGFKDSDGLAIQRDWDAENAHIRAKHQLAMSMHQARWAGVAAVVALAVLSLVLEAVPLAAGLLVLAGIAAARAAARSAPELVERGPRPVALPAVPRSSSAYQPLSELAASRRSLRALFGLVPTDVAEQAEDAATQAEQVVNELAIAVRALESAHADGASKPSAALGRLQADLQDAVAAYRELLATVDIAAAAGHESRTDEITSRVAGIRAAVTALRPSV